jgi:hypothetical protein
MRTPEEISLEIDEEEKKLLIAEEERDKIECEITDKRRAMDMLRVSVRDYENILIKAKCLVREHRHNLEQKKREFWRVRG